MSFSVLRRNNKPAVKPIFPADATVKLSMVGDTRLGLPFVAAN